VAEKPPKQQAFVTVASETIVNRRIDIRYPREAIPEITGMSVWGDEATLVNISVSGLLMESATRYAPGQRITVQFEGKFPTKRIKGRIVRCQVSAINEKRELRYHIALVFENRLILHSTAGAAPRSTAAKTKQGAACDADTASPKEEEPANAPGPVNRW
jgi:PilZ domain